MAPVIITVISMCDFDLSFRYPICTIKYLAPTTKICEIEEGIRFLK